MLLCGSQRKAAHRASALDWELRAELSHKPGHFYIVCAVFLWTNQGLSCLTRLFTHVD